jgi:hypothetical protein
VVGERNDARSHVQSIGQQNRCASRLSSWHQLGINLSRRLAISNSFDMTSSKCRTETRSKPLSLSGMIVQRATIIPISVVVGVLYLTVKARELKHIQYALFARRRHKFIHLTRDLLPVFIYSVSSYKFGAKLRTKENIITTPQRERDPVFPS